MVVVGRSNIVGKPSVNYSLNQNATVTYCHSKTTDLKGHTNQADILIAAVGKRILLRLSMLKKVQLSLMLG